MNFVDDSLAQPAMNLRVPQARVQGSTDLYQERPTPFIIWAAFVFRTSKCI